MHRILKRQLSQLGLDEQTLPGTTKEWATFLERISNAYDQSDDGLYTLKRSSDIASDEMETLYKKLREQASFSEENEAPMLRFSEQGKCEHANASGLSVLKAWEMNVGESLKEKYLTFIQRALLSNKKTTVEQSVGEITYSLRLIPIIDNGYVNIYGTDITELKLTEKNLIQAKNLADKANIEKSRFLENMSHELRTPMHSIMGFTDLCIKRVDDKKASTYLHNIEKSAVRLTGLLNNLLDLSKLESGKVQLSLKIKNLVDVCETSILELSALLKEKNLSVFIHSRSIVELVFDEKLIYQTLINLLSNAIKFSPVDSVITIEIKKQDFKLENKIVAGIEVIVHDQGLGIPKDELDSIFDKFIQSSKTSTDAGGTGLGLSICKEIIEFHHGKIWVENNANKQDSTSGSAFHFTLPLSLV